MAEGPGRRKDRKADSQAPFRGAVNGDILQSRELSTALVVMAGCAWLAVDRARLYRRDQADAGRRSAASARPTSPISRRAARAAISFDRRACAGRRRDPRHAPSPPLPRPPCWVRSASGWGAVKPKFGKLNPITGRQAPVQYQRLHRARQVRRQDHSDRLDRRLHRSGRASAQSASWASPAFGNRSARWARFSSW